MFVMLLNYFFSTRRPGRIVRVRTVSFATGTGRRMSTVTRPSR